MLLILLPFGSSVSQAHHEEIINLEKSEIEKEDQLEKSEMVESINSAKLSGGEKINSYKTRIQQARLIHQLIVQFYSASINFEAAHPSYYLLFLRLKLDC